jgi:O-antigen ligase
MNFYTRTQTKAAKQLKIVAYFIAFPNWVVLQNISLYFILIFYKTISEREKKIFALKSTMSIAAFFIGVGAFFSVIGAGFKFGETYFLYSLRILPNYFYWSIIVVFIGNQGLKFLKIEEIYKSIFFGLVSLIITFFVFDPIFDYLPFYNGSSENSFAFLLILFSPIATSYIYHTYRSNFYTILFILFITLAGFLSGSRSGSLLTLAGCLLTISFESRTKTLLTIVLSIVFIIVAPNVKDNTSIKNIIFKLNERTFNLIYLTDETLKTDFSYLTRLAMVEKGLDIFGNNIMSGVGIGNFGKTKGELDFLFEGGELISRKSELLETGVSAHNSYISFLAEGGVLLFLPFIFLILYPIGYFLINFNKIPHIQKSIYISVIFMSIHIWFISAMLNVFAWFVLGLVNACIIENKRIAPLKKNKKV